MVVGGAGPQLRLRLAGFSRFIPAAALLLHQFEYLGQFPNEAASHFTTSRLLSHAATASTTATAAAAQLLLPVLELRKRPAVWRL